MSRIQKILSLLMPYWLSKHGRRGWLLLIITITLTSLSTYSSVYFAEWNNTFYNALESREKNRILHEIFRFAYILAAMAIISVNRNYFLSWLELDWAPICDYRLFSLCRFYLCHHWFLIRKIDRLSFQNSQLATRKS